MPSDERLIVGKLINILESLMIMLNVINCKLLPITKATCTIFLLSYLAWIIDCVHECINNPNMSRLFWKWFKSIFSYIEIFKGLRLNCFKNIVHCIQLFLWFCDHKHVQIYNVIRFLNFTGKISCVSEPQMDSTYVLCLILL